MEVKLSGKKSIYEEIVEEYARFIRLGVLREGEKLPPAAPWRQSWASTPNTVERAFAALEKQGLIRTIPKKGAFVHRIADADEHAREESAAAVARDAARGAVCRRRTRTRRRNIRRRNRGRNAGRSIRPRRRE